MGRAISDALPVAECDSFMDCLSDLDLENEENILPGNMTKSRPQKTFLSPEKGERSVYGTPVEGSRQNYHVEVVKGKAVEKYRYLGDQDEDDEEEFAERLYVMLRRYVTFLGLDLKDTNQRAGNMHAAAPEGVFHYLNQKLEVTMECFASPLNCYFPTYCSAFLDTDGPFGSLGSFFDLEPLQGSFEVGPPYTEEVMHNTALHILKILNNSEQHYPLRPLSFVVFVPDWSVGTMGLDLMDGDDFSQFRKFYFVLKKFDHVYISGCQFWKDKGAKSQHRYYTVPHGTRAYVFRNRAGEEKWPLGPNFEAELRSAMAAKLNMATPANLPKVPKSTGIPKYIASNPILSSIRATPYSDTGVEEALLPPAWAGSLSWRNTRGAAADRSRIVPAEAQACVLPPPFKKNFDVWSGRGTPLEREGEDSDGWQIVNSKDQMFHHALHGRCHNDDAKYSGSQKIEKDVCEWRMEAANQKSGTKEPYSESSTLSSYSNYIVKKPKGPYGKHQKSFSPSFWGKTASKDMFERKQECSPSVAPLHTCSPHKVMSDSMATTDEPNSDTKSVFESIRLLTPFCDEKMDSPKTKKSNNVKINGKVKPNSASALKVGKHPPEHKTPSSRLHPQRSPSNWRKSHNDTNSPNHNIRTAKNS
eukprot:Platyproteum_vivax@DN5852_c0_g1_i1.p2